jgi:hypothetical protein
MTVQKNLKQRIRARMEETGESFMVARQAILKRVASQEEGTALPIAAPSTAPQSSSPVSIPDAPTDALPTEQPQATTERPLAAGNAQPVVEMRASHRAAVVRPLQKRIPTLEEQPSRFYDSAGKRTATRNPKKQFRMEVGFGRLTRKILIAVGQAYYIEPLNPRKLKHRGRPCQITELDDDYMPDLAAVRFLDEKGGWAKVDCRDLVPIQPPLKE